ncbi:MAG TPA: histidine phosphatase family protein [Candidatus Angelobacter sp.]|nr:histidine phosphatase family protein [Candidatus Angelobacter sp.]
MKAIDPGAEIYLVRHGETEWNRDGRLQGQQNSSLTARGREQAEQLGRLLSRLLGPQQRLIQASPLGRARETAAIIRQHVPGPELMIDSRLQEMTLGSWEGLTRTEVNKLCKGVVGGDSNAEWWFRAPGGESYDHFQERVRSWLAEQSGAVIAVSHGITTRMIRGEYLGLSRHERLSLPVRHGVIWRLRGGAVETIPQ